MFSKFAAIQDLAASHIGYNFQCSLNILKIDIVGGVSEQGRSKLALNNGTVPVDCHVISGLYYRQ